MKENKELNVKIGALLKFRLKCLGISQNQLAKILNSKPSTVAMWLSGANTIPVDKLLQIEKEFGFSTSKELTNDHFLSYPISMVDEMTRDIESEYNRLCEYHDNVAFGCQLMKHSKHIRYLKIIRKELFKINRIREVCDRNFEE